MFISSYRNSIEENYEKPYYVYRGQKVIKEVSIRNTGDVDSFVRVKIGKMFGTISEKGFFEEDKNQVLAYLGCWVWLTLAIRN